MSVETPIPELPKIDAVTMGRTLYESYWKRSVPLGETVEPFENLAASVKKVWYQLGADAIAIATPPMDYRTVILAAASTKLREQAASLRQSAWNASNPESKRELTIRAEALMAMVPIIRWL